VFDQYKEQEWREWSEGSHAMDSLRLYTMATIRCCYQHKQRKSVYAQYGTPSIKYGVSALL